MSKKGKKKKGGNTDPAEQIVEAPVAEETPVQEEAVEVIDAPVEEAVQEEIVSEAPEAVVEEVLIESEEAPETVEETTEPAGESSEESKEEASEEPTPENAELFEGEQAEGETGEEIDSGTVTVPLKHIVEAILFASQKPVSTKELVTILKGAAEADKENLSSPARPFARVKAEAVETAIDELRVDREAPTSTYEVRESATGWQLVTKIQYSPWLRQLFPENRSARISAPAMETLAIIAYRQPITRADLEAVRGVSVDGVMQTLLDRSLIKIAGRAEIPGRPLLYETTQHFMEHFGLTNLDDLPNAAELRKINLPKAPVPEEPAAAPAPATTEAATETPVAEPSLPTTEETSASEEPTPVEESMVPEEAPAVPSEESAVAEAEASVAFEKEIPVEKPAADEEAPAPHDQP